VIGERVAARNVGLGGTSRVTDFRLAVCRKTIPRSWLSREAAKDHSPGLQPCVNRIRRHALKVASERGSSLQHVARAGTDVRAHNLISTPSLGHTPSVAARETHRSRPRRRPRPRESLFVANWVGIGSMCSVRIAPALRVGDAFRALLTTPIPRAEALGYDV
jgi:hypothetical protein